MDTPSLWVVGTDSNFVGSGRITRQWSKVKEQTLKHKTSVSVREVCFGSPCYQLNF